MHYTDKPPSECRCMSFARYTGGRTAKPASLRASAARSRSTEVISQVAADQLGFSFSAWAASCKVRWGGIDGTEAVDVFF